MNLNRFKWSKRKYFIRINCWLIILILLAVLCFCFPIISNAEEVSPSPSPVPVPNGYSSFGDYFSVTNDYIYTPDNITELPSGAIDPVEWNDGSFNFNYFDGDMSNGELCISSSLPSSRFYGYYLTDDGQLVDMHEYFLSDYFSHWFISYNPVASSFQCSFTDMPIQEIDASSIGFQGFAKYPYAAQDTILRYNILLYFEPMNGYQNCYSINSLPQQYYFSIIGEDYGEYNNLYADSWDYTLFTVNLSDVENIFATNFGNLYTNIPSERNGCDETRVYLNDQRTEIGSEIYGEPHYLFGHISNDDVVYPDGSGGDDSNNLYMRTADWRFNIPSYWGNVTSSTVQPKYENSWGSGSILFYGLLNDYQKANADNFNLDFKFHIWCSGHYFSDVNSEINGNFYGSFDFTDQVSLTNFINNNNSCSFSVDDIFEFSQNSSATSFNDFLDSDVKGHNSIDTWNWYITCDACLSASAGSSGHIIEKYNFISQVSEETSNSITDNNDPYIPDDGSSPNTDNNQSPSNNDGYSKNGININNNPVITITNTNNNNSSAMNEVNNGNGNPFNILIDKLFGNGTVQEGSIGGTTQNQLLENTGASNWLAVMGASFSWIPASVWLELQLFFYICLGILVVGFILRIILDFL